MSRPLMPPRELHHLVNTVLASNSSWFRPGVPLKPGSEIDPTSIWSAVTPRPVAALVSPDGFGPHTGLVMVPKAALVALAVVPGP